MGLGDQPAQVTRGVVSVPTIDQSGARTAADALDKVGGQIREFSERIRKEKEDHELVKADADMRVRMDKARQLIELDPETPDAAIPQRWKQESEQIIKEVGGGISSSRARELWEIRARGVQGEGDVWSQSLQRKRQVDKVGGAYITMASEAEAMAGDPSISPETYASKLDGLRALTATHLAGGFIGPEVAATRGAQLADFAVKYKSARWTSGIAALAEQGQFEQAEQLVADAKEAGGIPAAVLADAKSTITRERNRFKVEQAERWNTNDANFQVGILEGKNGYQHIDDAIARGDLNPAQRDTLYRAVRAEEDRRNAEAERSALSRAEKLEAEEASKDARFILDALALTNESLFLSGYDKWPSPYQNAFDAMTGDGKRAVLLKTLEQPKGDRASAAKETLNTLLDEAKRVVPEWKLGSDADPAKLPKDTIPFKGELLKVAESIAKDKDGKPLTVDEARDAVARALREYQPDKWMGLPTNQRDVYLENPGAASFKTEAGIMATDGGSRFAYDEGANIRNDIRAEWIKAKGKPPTKAELDAEYARVVAD